MKRILYTIALVALFGAMSHAQTTMSAEPAKKTEPAKAQSATRADQAAEPAKPQSATRNDQAAEPAKPQSASKADPATESVNPDGSVKAQPAKSDQDTKQPAAKKSTRMAITEKGVPASKNKETKSDTKK